MSENNREIIRYIDIESEGYKRAYANTTLTTSSPSGDIVIDFCEESLKPYLVVERPVGDIFDENEILFNRPRNVLEIEREMKFSVTMGK
ncbi:hypothetical protein FY526_26880, partial [Clostridioides difficile]